MQQDYSAEELGEDRQGQLGGDQTPYHGQVSEKSCRGEWSLTQWGHSALENSGSCATASQDWKGMRG